MPDAMKEKRRFARLNLLADTFYKKKTVPQKKKLSLFKNISIGGICLIAYEELQAGDLLDLEIYLPGYNIPINIVGRVVWVKEFVIGGPPAEKRFDAGVEFIEAKEEDVKEIGKYIANYVAY